MEKKASNDGFNELPAEYEESPSKRDQKEHKKPKNMLSGNMAAIFVNSAVTGSSILTLPFALKESGWFGVFLILICGMNALYCGMVIGWCWIILQKRWPEYRRNHRIPYAEIAFRVGGEGFKYAVLIIVVFNQIVFCLLYLTLIAQLTEEATSQHMKYCYVIIVCIFLLIPLTWFGSPKDFWAFAVIDLIACSLFIAVTLVAFFIDKRRVGLFSVYKNPKPLDIVKSYGAIIFAFTGGAMQPTIQTDMSNRKIFPQSTFTAYLIILLLYLPVPILGYAAYGSDTSYNILENISQNPDLNGVTTFLYVLFIIHMCMTSVIHLNPVFQTFEHLLNFRKEFGWHRCLLRSGVMIVLLPVAFTVPFISAAIQFGGALTINLLTTIFPIVFYVCLVYQKGHKSKNRTITKKKSAFLLDITLLGCLGIVASYFHASYRFSQMGNFYVNCYTSDTVSNNTALGQAENITGAFYG